MNKILERQLKKIFGSVENTPKGLDAFLKSVSDTYDHADEDRIMVERSMEISSKELGALNRKAQEKSKNLEATVIESERMNKLMIKRELKMIELKKEIEELKTRKI